MKKTLCYFMLAIMVSAQATGQELSLSPKNNPSNMDLLESEISKMSWFMIKDTTEVKIGEIHTEIKKDEDRILITTTVLMEQSTNKWVDSTIVNAQNFKPVYHSSFNLQRDMILKFGDKITGYYLDKQTSDKKVISIETNRSFFDSNFYPQLIRLLPLEDGYSKTISIFDYNPKSNIGVISATIHSTEKTTLTYNKKPKQVWKVETTDDISNNTAISTYYIEISSRKIIKQVVDFGGRKMIMRSIE
ncbi:hypothetical protein [Flagellimonas beolgyonensis]|uniref:DUF3108 domain-containing protein n=1 Tax=Flagellimonas beolgyonensis TaxID=864064 RepID=UPI003D65427B